MNTRLNKQRHKQIERKTNRDIILCETVGESRMAINCSLLCLKMIWLWSSELKWFYDVRKRVHWQGQSVALILFASVTITSSHWSNASLLFLLMTITRFKSHISHNVFWHCLESYYKWLITAMNKTERKVCCEVTFGESFEHCRCVLLMVTSGKTTIKW